MDRNPSLPSSSNLKRQIPRTFQLQTIGVIHTCFPEKFGIPRQPNLAPAAKGVIELLPPYDQPAAVQGLELASHLWIEFIFHHNQNVAWRPSIRPPRLGGNEKMGVFATRSPVRPNGLGLSVVALERVEANQKGTYLYVSGIDVVDGTPIVDIKPYVPYVDSLPDARNGLAQSAPLMMKVVWSCEAQALVEKDATLKSLVEQVLGQDPRPQYHALDTEREYGMLLSSYNITWRYEPSNGEKTEKNQKGKEGENKSAWCIRVQAITPVHEK